MNIDIKVGSIIAVDNKYFCMVCEDLINVFFLLDLKNGITKGVGDKIYHYCNFYEFKQKILNTFDDIKVIHK